MNICPACHGEVSVSARFCPDCGVEQASPASEPRLYPEVCEIDLWRGYAASEFYARAGADGEAVARSPAFTWRRGVPDENAEQVRNAHAALVRALLEDGWQPDGQGPHWFNRRFFRDVDLRLSTAAPRAWAPPPALEAADEGWIELPPPNGPEDELPEAAAEWAEPAPELYEAEADPEQAYEPEDGYEPAPDPEPLAEPAPEPDADPEPELLIHSVTTVPPEPLAAARARQVRDGLVLRLASRERAVQLISIAGLASSVVVGWRVLF